VGDPPSPLAGRTLTLAHSPPPILGKVGAGAHKLAIISAATSCDFACLNRDIWASWPDSIPSWAIRFVSALEPTHTPVQLALRHEGVWGSTCTYPCILDLGASGKPHNPVALTSAKQTPVPRAV
jgi:hypothetical protein